jgi:hypothetical protein
VKGERDFFVLRLSPFVFFWTIKSPHKAGVLSAVIIIIQLSFAT